MSASVQIDGLDELIRAITSAPAAIREQGMVIVREETLGAEQELRAALPRKTGTLERRVKTTFPSSTVLVGLLQSTAPHSHLWHWGTKDRATRSGANRGRMPAASPDPLVPIARRRRERMYRRLADMLRAMGFEVSGV